jgi:hypothetical protein
MQSGVSGGLQLWDERHGPRPVSRSSNSWGHTGCGLMDRQMGPLRQVGPVAGRAACKSCVQQQFTAAMQCRLTLAPEQDFQAAMLTSILDRLPLRWPANQAASCAVMVCVFDTPCPCCPAVAVSRCASLSAHVGCHWIFWWHCCHLGPALPLSPPGPHRVAAN